MILFSVFSLVLVSIEKFVKNTPLCVVFSTLFPVFGNVLKHSLYDNSMNSRALIG